MPKIRKCRNCKTRFRPVGRDLCFWYVEACCSKKCYEVIGPMPVVNTNNVVVRRYKPLRTRSPAEKTSRRQNKLVRNDARENRKKTRKDQFYRDSRWLELRYDVIKKYGRVCLACGKEGGEIHVDHIIPKSKRPDLQYSFDNLQVLCRECNLGKSNRDATDFRPKEEILPLECGLDEIEEDPADYAGNWDTGHKG